MGRANYAIRIEMYMAVMGLSPVCVLGTTGNAYLIYTYNHIIVQLLALPTYCLCMFWQRKLRSSSTVVTNYVSQLDLAKKYISDKADPDGFRLEYINDDIGEYRFSCYIRHSNP